MFSRRRQLNVQLLRPGGGSDEDREAASESSSIRPVGHLFLQQAEEIFMARGRQPIDRVVNLIV
jgi:hypothetical protein